VTDYAPYQGSAFQPVPLASGPVRPLRIPAWIASVTLGLIGLEALITGGLQASLYPATLSPADATDTQIAINDFLIQRERAVAVMLTLFAGVAFVVWLYRARTNLDRFGGRELTWTRGWSVGGWVIPLGNVVIPQLVVYEVDRHSERLADEVAGRPHRRHRAAAVTWVSLWSLFLVCSQVGDTVLDALEPGPSVLLGGVLGIFEAAAAVSAILLVWQITTHQDRIRLAQQHRG
jgi:hypothetical protein